MVRTYLGVSSLLFGLAGPLLATGCGGGGRDETDPMGMTVGNTNGQTSGPATSGTESADESTEGDGGPKLDVMFDTDGMMTGGDIDQSGCDKVDFLFVIDNSGSMGDEQDNLIASFPQFIDTIQNTLDEAQDYHIMVLDVDAWQYQMCENMCTAAPPECINAMGLCDLTAGPACLFPCTLGLVCGLDGGFECGVTMPMECEDVLGAGVTYPRGQGSSNQDCSFATGARYIDSAEPDLAGAFACAPSP